MFEELLPVVGDIYLVQADHPRAADPAQVAEILKDSAHQVRQVSSVEDVFSLLPQYRGADQVVLVTGSLYLVGHFRRLWFQK